MTEIPGTSITFKKEDKVVMGFVVAGIGLAVAGAGYGLYRLLPYLVEMAENTLVLLGLLGAAGFVAIFLLQLVLARQAIYLKLKLFARNLRKSIIKSDPIGTLDIGIARFEQRLEEVKARVVDATASQKKLAGQIRNTKKDGVLDKAENAERLADVAQAQGLPKAQVDVQLIAAERWHRAGKNLQELLDGQRFRQSKLSEAQMLCEAGLTNLRNQKEVLAVQLDAYKAEAAQARAFKRFFSMNEDLEMIDMAVEEVERQSAQCEAEVELMIQQAEPMLRQEKLQQEADALSARARLAAAKAPERIEAPAPPKSVINIDRK